MTTPFWTLSGVSVQRGARTVLREVDLQVPPGAAVGVLGPSGAGKTTLLGVLDGSVEPYAGRVQQEGQVRTGPLERSARAAVGFVHQDLALVPYVRVVHNVLVGAVGRLGPLEALRWAVSPPWQEVEAAHAALTRVGLGDRVFDRIEALSGGEQQRVAVARALFQRPRALLADEPVSSLDPLRARQTLSWLVQLCRDVGLTLVTSLHDPVLAREYLDHAVGLREGRVVWTGPAAALTDEVLTEIYAEPR